MTSHAKSFRLVALLALLLSLLLAACGDTPTNTPAATTAASSATTAAGSAATTAAGAATTAAASGPNVTLEMWIMPNSAKSVDDVQKVLADFYKANPNIKVNVTEVGWGDALTKITTALQSGVGPDITQVGTTWVGGFAVTKGLRTFTDAEVTAMGGGNNFTEAAWNTSRLLGSNEVVAIPWFVETRALLYRTDVLQKAGLDPATAFKDWTSFSDSLRKMKDAGAGMIKAPFAYPGKGDWNVVHNFAPWVWSAGGEILNKEGSKAAFNSEAGVSGAQFYSKLYSDGLVLKEALEKNTADVEAFWGNGDIGAVIGGPWMIKNAKLPKSLNGYSESLVAKNMGATVIPAGPAGAKPFVGGSNLVVMKASKNQDAAVKVVQYLASKKAQLDYADITGNLPATRDGQADARYTGDPLYKVFLDSLKTGRSYPTVAAWNGIEEAVKKNLSILWDDVAAGKTTTVKERLDAAAKEVDVLIAASK